MDGTVDAPGPLRILGLADDLTGAVALAAELTGGGLATPVLRAHAIDAPPEGRGVVLDTNSRRLAPSEAAGVIGRIVEALRSRIGPETIVIKRVDSGLRGPWPAELATLSKVLERAVVAATAAPALGVTVEAGVQHLAGAPASASHYALDGESFAGDALVSAMPAPAMSISIDRLGEPAFPETLGPLLARHRALVCDGSTPIHLAWAARAIVRVPEVIAVATYGLGRELARAINEGQHEPAVVQAPVLALVGTDKAATTRQVDDLRSGGWTMVAATHPDAEREVARRLLRGERVVLEVGRGGTGVRDPRHASEVAAVGARVVAAVPGVRVIIIGGETASAFAAAAGITSIEPVAEPWPTIPVVRMRAGAGTAVLAIVKSGAQGEPWWLGHAADTVVAWPMPESRSVRRMPRAFVRHR